jgi:excisionase family DNA binding protein
MIEFKTSRLASILGVHRNTVRNWIKTGRLQAKPSIGRRYAISRTALTEFLESRHVPAGKIRELTGDLKEKKPLSHKHLSKTQKIHKEVPMSDKPVGSVLIAGGGIAGIQASLDLAESGYFVYLLEKTPGIGGNMARLDKTFPTNDCAM